MSTRDFDVVTGPAIADRNAPAPHALERAPAMPAPARREPAPARLTGAPPAARTQSS